MSNAVDAELKDIDEAIKKGLDKVGEAVRTGFGQPDQQAETVSPQDCGPIQCEDEPETTNA